VRQGPSDLCADAQALAASNGKRVADGSDTVVDRLDSAVGGALDVAGVVDDSKNLCWLYEDAFACLVGPKGRQDLATLHKAFEVWAVVHAALVDEAQTAIANGLGLKGLWVEYKAELADAEAKSDARNLVSQVESCFTDTLTYNRCDRPTGPLSDKNTGLSWGSGPGQVEVVGATSRSYRIISHSKSGTDFTITKHGSGNVTRTCSKPDFGACDTDGRW
jgi:type IV pilus assembly protein PilA